MGCQHGCLSCDRDALMEGRRQPQCWRHMNMNLGFTAEESQLHSGAPPPCEGQLCPTGKNSDVSFQQIRFLSARTHTHRRHLPNPGRTIHPRDASVLIFSALESGTFRGEVTGAQTVGTCRSRMWNSVNTQNANHCCRERLKAGGEGGHRGRDAWMASPTQWT